MRAEIISIGTELLVGSVLNSNAQFLSRRLAENALDLYHQVTVGDNRTRILEALEQAAGRSDLIITTGGLGPTEDDITMRTMAEFAGRHLVLHKSTYKHVKDRLQARGFALSPLVARQCYVPMGAVVMKNARGTAPGVLIELLREGRKNWLLALPGPPRELQPMFNEKALPLLSKRMKLGREAFFIRSIRITGLIEAQVAEKVTDLLKWKPPLTVGIYAKPGEVELKIMAKAPSQKKSQTLAARAEKIIRARLKDHVLGTDDDTLSSVVGKRLLEAKKSVALAESCTGGLAASLLTDTAGSSDYFKGGMVCYSNQAKTDLLGVDPKLIQKHGAVSRQVAIQMAEQIKRRFGSDYGVGITGIAGPSGGSKKKPVGLVCIAVAGGGKTCCRECKFLGNRSDVKGQGARTALDLLRLRLKKRL